MSPTQKTGKNILISMFAILLVTDAISISIQYFSNEISTLPTGITRIILTVLLCYAVYMGKNWAKWLTVSLVGIASLILIFILLQAPSPLLVGFTVFLLNMLYFLLFSEPVNSFLKSQRNYQT